MTRPESAMTARDGGCDANRGSTHARDDDSSVELRSSDEKQFQTTQLINLVDFATRFKWSPWRDIQPRATTEEADDSTDMTQLRRWRLKCDLMRVATYYRVTGAQMES